MDSIRSSVSTVDLPLDECDGLDGIVRALEQHQSQSTPAAVPTERSLPAAVSGMPAVVNCKEPSREEREEELTRLEASLTAELQDLFTCTRCFACVIG